MSTKRNTGGYLFAFASVVCYGTAAIFIRAAYAHGATAWATYAIQCLTATTILAFVALKRPYAYKLSLRHIGTLCLLGLIGFIAYFCFYLSLQYVVSAIASLLLYTYPLLVNLGAVVFFREKLSIWQILCLLLSTAGIALTAGIFPSELGKLPFPGILFGLASSLMTAVYSL
ncbi:MAG: DMT family transporter, partial [Thermacetogeniaceae bacterium]